MSLKRMVALVLVLVAGASVADLAQAHEPVCWRPYRMAQNYAWHGNYIHSEWGGPVALVVPPTAQIRTDYGWGVGNTRIRRIDHQFRRPFPGSVSADGQFRATPPWPSDTTQFGVYYVRGPW